MIQTTIKDIIIGMLAVAVVCFVIGYCIGYISGIIKSEAKKRGKL